MTADKRLVPPGAPDLDDAKAAFADLAATVAALRDPQCGCPWDLKQDHASLRRYMIEEAYEAAEAMAAGDDDAMREELGDVLLQVVLNAQIAHDRGAFAIADVARGIDAKMRRRHPHVFGTQAEKQALSSEQVRANWDIIKSGEKASHGEAPRKGLFAGVEGVGPAAIQAHKIGKLAARIRFDWDAPAEVLAQVRSEVDEVADALRQGAASGVIAEEIGDVYFSLAQLCRHVGVDPEVVALDANRKFLRRFAALEDLAAQRGQDVAKASREDLEGLWRDVKTLERKG